MTAWNPPSAIGSTSTCTIGLYDAMPVWFENDAPNTSSRSDSFMSQMATGVPLRPSTPHAERMVVGDQALRLEGRDDRGAEPLGERHDLVASRARAVARRRSPAAARRASSVGAPRRAPPPADDRAIARAGRPARPRPRRRRAPAPRRAARDARRPAASTACLHGQRDRARRARAPTHRLRVQHATPPNASRQVDVLERAAPAHADESTWPVSAITGAPSTLRVPQPGQQVRRPRPGDRRGTRPGGR